MKILALLCMAGKDRIFVAYFNPTDRFEGCESVDRVTVGYAAFAEE